VCGKATGPCTFCKLSRSLSGCHDECVGAVMLDAKNDLARAVAAFSQGFHGLVIKVS